MQVTNTAGVKAAGEKKQSGIHMPERRLSREEAAARRGSDAAEAPVEGEAAASDEIA